MIESWVTISITKKMYGWSKWGGAREGACKEDLEEWFCQVCGGQQIRVLPSYLFPFGEQGREFIRICTLCKAKSILKSLRLKTPL